MRIVALLVLVGCGGVSIETPADPPPPVDGGIGGSGGAGGDDADWVVVDLPPVDAGIPDAIDVVPPNPCNWPYDEGPHPPGCVCPLECPETPDMCIGRTCDNLGTCGEQLISPGVSCGKGGVCDGNGNCIEP